MNNPTTVTVRIKDVTPKGFYIMLQPQQSLIGQVSTAERVARVAIEPGASSTLEAGLVQVSSNPVNVTSTLVTTANYYGTTPVILATMNTYYEPDSAAPRITAIGDNYFTIFIEEEQSADTETWHTTELVGYIVLLPP